MRTGLRNVSLMLGFMVLCLGGHTFAWLRQSTNAPVINTKKSSYQIDTGKLVIKGENFHPQAEVRLNNQAGLINNASIKIKGPKKIYVSNLAQTEISDGIDVTITNPDGGTTGIVHLTLDVVDERKLTVRDIETIIAQAVAQAEASSLKATIAVADKEGNVLGVFQMADAAATTVISHPSRPARGGLEGQEVPASLASISKAVTGSFLSTQGHAFTTRTAGFIVQEHFPPSVNFQPSGPLFGVQFSQLLVCSDINPRAPLGLSADPGGVPLYKNGLHVGGIGVEGNGKYTFDPDPMDRDMPVEELVAVAATRGFEPPADITGDKILVNGFRFPFVNTPLPPALSITPFDRLRGDVITIPGIALGIRGAQQSKFRSISLDGVQGRVDDRFFPFKQSSALTTGEVQRIILQASKQAFITRAAIRRPLNSAAEVNIAVVDTDGQVLGIFSTPDAPIFGFDVCVQKARTAAFFSNAEAAARLRRAKYEEYVDAAISDGIRLDGSVAFSTRAEGFLSVPFYPDGIDGTEPGPFSVSIEQFSPFNNGFQLDVLVAVRRFLETGALSPNDCTGIVGLANGIQIFAGSVPLYKNGRIVGAIGISGDGIDQDDLIAAMGSAGFEAPPDIRSDRLFVRGVRLPYVKFPRHPNR